MDAVRDVVGEVASVPAIEKIPNPLRAAASGLRDGGEREGPSRLGVRESAGGPEEAPSFVGSWKGGLGHLRRFRFGETTNALFEPAIQSNRWDCGTF